MKWRHCICLAVLLADLKIFVQKSGSRYDALAADSACVYWGAGKTENEALAKLKTSYPKKPLSCEKKPAARRK